MICDAKRVIDLTLTARLPTMEKTPPRHDEPVRVTVTDHPASIVVVGPRWRKEALRLNQRVLTTEINKVSLHWPMPPTPGEAALEAAIARLEVGPGGRRPSHLRRNLCSGGTTVLR